eukprot:m51a1_g395 hypothetical protein (118) ;mRNA; f:704063-704416
MAAHSPVLRVALWGNGSGAVFAEQRAGEVRLEDVDEGLMSVLLEFLYTGASASDVPGAPVDLYMQLAVLADRLTSPCSAASAQPAWPSASALVIPNTPRPASAASLRCDGCWREGQG